MNKNQHWGWRMLAVLFALSLVAAACGGDDDDVATGSGDGSEDADSGGGDDSGGDDSGGGDAAPAPEGSISDECPIPNPSETVEIDMMGWSFPIADQYAAELEECEAGNYSFNVQFLDSQAARDQVTLDLSTGDPSFEIVQGSNSFIIELANQDLLRPLNDLIDKYSADYGLDEIDPAFYELASIDGNIYALPMVSNTMHLFYNEPVMSELGLEVPTTFDEAVALCGPLDEAGYPGFQMMLSAGWSWQIEFDSVLGSLGVDPVDPETGQPNFNSPEGIEAANILVDVLENCGGSTASSYTTDDIQSAFQTGEYVIGHTWASRAGAMDDAEASTVVGEVQFAPALTAGGGDTLAAPAYIDGYGIPAGIDDARAEQIFLAMVAATDSESQQAAAEFGGVTRAGISNENGPRNTEAAAVSFVDGKGPDLTHPAAGIARSKLGDALITILDGTSVEDALAAAEAEYLAEAEAQGLLEAS